MTFDKNYLSFYIDGRENPFSESVDLEPLAKRLLAGASVRDIAMEAAKDLAKRYERDGSERLWCKRAKNAAEIKDAGGDGHAAWTMYLQGMTEAFARELETEILDEADAIVDREGDEDGDDAGEPADD